MVVFAGFIVSRAITLFQHNLAQALRDIEREREKRKESSDAHLEVVEAIKNYQKTRENGTILSTEISAALSRMINIDKLRIIILLTQKKMIELTDPVVDLDGVDLQDVEFWRYRRGFVDCSFRGANFKGASLKDANLKGSDLSFTDLENVDFTDADLENVRLFQAKYVPSDLNKAKSLKYVTLSNKTTNFGDKLDQLP